MQHRLGWLHVLDVEYDASTFDTDPFEPQPDGAGTIFPFWVGDAEGSGFVELPYTLIQDFNLFEVLREQNIDIWKRKVDWVAEHGGMVLLNTHPDYMCFEGRPGRDEFPVSHYDELLRYLRERHRDTYWTALPREVARYYRERVPFPLRNTRKKICMVAYTPYEADNRVRRYAETLVRRGDRVDVIAISGAHLGPAETEINGVTVYRVSAPTERGADSGRRTPPGTTARPNRPRRSGYTHASSPSTVSTWPSCQRAPCRSPLRLRGESTPAANFSAFLQHRLRDVQRQIAETRQLGEQTRDPPARAARTSCRPSVLDIRACSTYILRR